MEIQIRHSPSYAVARLFLAPNEPARIQSGAMVAHSAGVEITAKAEGGILGGLKRSFLANESFFTTTATAPAQGGWIDITNSLPGDVIVLPMTPDRPFFVTRGCWLANSWNVQTDTQFGGFQNLFGGEGGFGLRVFGDGQTVLGVHGALDVVDLAPGEAITIDTGHVVAYDLNIQFQMRKASTGILNTLKSGEGFVFEFYGPGRIFMQSRAQPAVATTTA